jgi:DNA-3-methyladenine glycosylase II
MDGATAIAELTAIKGIGGWTAQVYLLFCAGHPDVFPVGDVALQNAVGHALALDARPSARELEALTELWSPWRSVAARLFWAYYATQMRRDGLPVPP